MKTEIKAALITILFVALLTIVIFTVYYYPQPSIAIITCISLVWGIYCFYKLIYFLLKKD